jgi:anthranilate 1,2-dioxygenase (deaminating, decarboxylating) large subunit
MGTPDDLTEFREAQRGFQGRMEKWNDISRGCDKWITGNTPNAETLGINPVLTGTELTHEGLYVNQHGAWRDALVKGVDARIQSAQRFAQANEGDQQ